MEGVWVLYCENFDADETVKIDDGKWQPLRERSSSGSADTGH